VAIEGCGKAAPAAPPAGPPPQVAVIVAESKTIPVTYRFIGQTEPSKTVEVRSRITGFLLTRSFDEGKAIKAGDVLFTIDPRPYEADLEIARARVAQTEARVGLAEADLRRFEEAAAVNAVSKADLDKAQTELVEARAAVNLAKAERAKEELNLSYTKVMSPVTGLIGRALKDEGAYLDAGSNSLLAVATQVDPMYVVFPVPERDWLRWREQAQSGEIRPAYTNPDGSPPNIKNPQPPVKVELLDGTPYPVEGRLNFFDTKVDAGTGSALARATFTNPDLQLKAGLFVHATIVGWERPNSIVVPQRAVINNPGGSFLFVVNGESVTEMRKITVGDWKGDGWLVLSGVKPGDVVVADGFAKAPPGTKVTTVPFVSPAAAAAAGGKPAETKPSEPKPADAKPAAH
jgi:membrane fusion protein (multidrug efflux system)